MLPSKALLCLALSSLIMVGADYQKQKRGPKGSGRRSRSSSSTDDFWFWVYHMSSNSYQPTPMSMEEFAQENVRIMWENRPAHAMAATCINSPWSVKDYDKVSPAIRVTYFVKTSFLHLEPRMRLFDCLYIWGPNQQFYSSDDVKEDRMSYTIDGEKCTMDNKTMDITCL
ncbi:uncharacterized protein UTRI_01124 [Ustilago trichophora]|uniref:DUF7888 domain-containing protein n=1 Tax=Ustilago trichophora TaxID=86804 RepID=A0A5C3DYZ0_9BASI|nr:uncharacterized protein UTRI_01124 [Ustilago trichophora]